jgi:tryptophan-rich sensory protein
MAFWKKLLLSVVTVQLLGNASGLVTFVALDGWYESLTRPPGTPPEGVFGPVWFVVYTMIGAALALLWDSPASTGPKRKALQRFALQFGLNLLWTPLFFGLQRIDLAFGLILLLLLAILLSITAAYRVRPLAALLLVPYALWVGYATYLNLGFLLLN